MPSPIINDTVPFIQYTATGGQTTFPYPFAIFEDADLSVYKRGANSTPADAAQLLQLNVDYTVTDAGSDTGGNVVLTAGATLNDVITVNRNLALERRTVFQPGTLTDESLNEEFNNMLAMVQDLNMRMAKIIPSYNFSAVFNQNNMKLPLLPAGYIWRMNVAGTAIEAVALVDSDPGASILRADLASHAHGVGASMIGLESGDTVQEFVDSISDSVIYGIDVSVDADSVEVNFSPPLIAYKEGDIYVVRFANDGTGAAVAQFNGLAITPLKYPAGDDLVDGDILANKVGIISYVENDGDPYLQLLNPGTLILSEEKAMTLSAHLGSNFSSIVAEAKKVPFNTVEWNDGITWDAGNKWAVLNKAGKYRISTFLAAVITNCEYALYLYINGAPERIISIGTSGGVGTVGSGSEAATIFKTLNITDKVEIYVYNNGGSFTVLSGKTTSFFQIEYLGEN